MKVSIITAVLNGADSIIRTMESVAEQDYLSVEHVIVDGGSVDGTLEKVRMFERPAMSVFSGPDTGVYSAFNKGLLKATGEIVAYLGSGDRYASRSVVSEMVGMLSLRQVDAVFSDLLIVDPNLHSRVIRNYSSRCFRPSTMPYGFMPAHPTLFVYRYVYDQVGWYNSQFRIAGDFEFCLRAFYCHHFAYHYIAKSMVTMTSGGLSNRGWKSKLAITREMLFACKINNVKSSWLHLCLRFPAKLLELI